MPNINTLLLGGNLCHEPEKRFTTKGTCVVRFDIAVNRRFKAENGDLREEVTFVECECFGQSAETFSEHFHKGNPVLIEGRLRQQRWEDKDTKKPRTKLSVVVEKWHFVAPPPASKSTGQPATEQVNPETGTPF
jgi:single-strand DNA-binding protein